MTNFDPAAPAAEWPDARNMTDREFADACRKLRDHAATQARQIDDAASLAAIKRRYGGKDSK